MRTVLIATLIVAATTAFAQPGNRIRFNDQDLFLSGGNVAWIQFAQDIGPGTTRLDVFRQSFEDVRDNGGNAMRFWMHTNGTRSPEWDGSRVVGPGEEALVVVQILKKRYPTLPIFRSSSQPVFIVNPGCPIGCMLPAKPGWRSTCCGRWIH